MKSKLAAILSAAVLTVASGSLSADEIKGDQLPAEVRQVLEQYVQVLRESASLDECAQKFSAVAGGTLVNEDGSTLRSSVKDFGLKKDRNDIKFYASPIVITRVQTTKSAKQGYGASAITGTTYKIWLGRTDKATGMPAPVTILAPENHPTIKSPKVVNIGSF